jgi:pyroglutamyl-peptidase
MDTVLVTGFGPFEGVADNPTAALARAVDGQTRGALRFVGRVLPVSFAEAPATTLELARELGAAFVVGTGVAMGRSEVTVERWGRRPVPGRPDVTGQLARPPDGPASLCSSLDPDALARALGGTVSLDAGSYVCNAWLYEVVGGLGVPVTFVHVPPVGLDADLLITALHRVCSRP